jgi:hypothetical protein
LETFIIVLPRDLASGDYPYRTIKQLLHFLKHAQESGVPVGPVFDGAIKDLNKRAFPIEEPGWEPAIERREIVCAALKVIAESMSTDGFARGRRSQRAQALDQAIDEMILGSERWSRENGWSYWPISPTGVLGSGARHLQRALANLRPADPRSRSYDTRRCPSWDSAEAARATLRWRAFASSFEGGLRASAGGITVCLGSALAGGFGGGCITERLGCGAEGVGAGAGPLPTFCGSIGPVGCAALAASFAPGFIDLAKLPFGSETAPLASLGVLAEVA